MNQSNITQSTNVNLSDIERHLVNSVLNIVKRDIDKYNLILTSIAREIQALRSTNSIHSKHDDKNEQSIASLTEKINSTKLTMTSMSSQVDHNVKLIADLKAQCHDHYERLNEVGQSLNEKQIAIVKQNDKLRQINKEFSNIDKDIKAICSKLDTLEAEYHQLMSKVNQGIGIGITLWKLGAIITGSIGLALAIKQLLFGG